MIGKISAFAALVSIAVVGSLQAQQPAVPPPQQGIKRIPLQRVEIPGSNYEAVFGIAELAPNVNVGRHTHPGIESGYLMEGEATLIVDGQGERASKAGDSWQLPIGVVHDARAGDKGAKVIAVYIVEKGKPLASPAK